MKWIKYILITAVSLLVLLGLVIYTYLQQHKPRYSGEVKLKGLSSKTEVHFDTYGIPHIYGESEEDVFRTLGYIHAMERLFQMEMIRRVSSGRLSELFGASTLEIDKFFRMLDFTSHAIASEKEFYSDQNLPSHKLALAYLEGINQYIKTESRPIEFKLIGINPEEYKVRDLYLIVSYISFNFQMAFRTDPLLERILNKAGKEYYQDLTGRMLTNSDSISNSYPKSISETGNSFSDFILPIQPWTGSNALVISSTRSASRKTLFSNDTHIGHQQPAVWHEAHLDCPGFRFYGNFLAGFPFAPLGRTERHAWGLTIFENDDLDFYRQQVNRENPNQVKYKGEWVNLELRDEIIKVKDSLDVKFRFRVGSYGPVCSDVMSDFIEDKNNVVSVCWAFLNEKNNLLDVTYGLAHSRSLGEFEQHVSRINAPGLNVLYGDLENNIAWWAAGKIVQRPEHVDPNLVLDGNSGSNDWTGYNDFSQNPKSVNPESGFVFSCNQQPDHTNNKNLPGYFLTEDRTHRPEDRTHRLLDLVNSVEKFDVNTLKSVQRDIRNTKLAELCRKMCMEIDTNTFHINARERVILRELIRWDGSHDLDNLSAGFFNRWHHNLLHLALVDEMGEKDFHAFLKTHVKKDCMEKIITKKSSPWWDDIGTKEKKETLSEVLMSSFQRTVEDMTIHLGNDIRQWKWSRMHRLEIEHPIG
ncbi:MAG: penicillin acylase family protein, partial [Bacteroidetes bacterium]